MFHTWAFVTLGAKRLNSLIQFGMVERGATTRKGPDTPISYRWQNRAGTGHISIIHMSIIKKQENYDTTVLFVPIT